MIKVKSIFYGIMGIIIGIFLFGMGCNTLLHPGQVTCGGETMSQGDTCEHYENGTQTGTSDYAQQQQNNTITGLLSLGGGVLLFCAGVVFVLPRKKKQSTGYPVNTMGQRAQADPRWQQQSGNYPPYPQQQQPGNYPPYPQQPRN